eukprot:941_1
MSEDGSETEHECTVSALKSFLVLRQRQCSEQSAKSMANCYKNLFDDLSTTYEDESAVIHDITSWCSKDLWGRLKTDLSQYIEGKVLNTTFVPHFIIDSGKRQKDSKKNKKKRSSKKNQKEDKKEKAKEKGKKKKKKQTTETSDKIEKSDSEDVEKPIDYGALRLDSILIQLRRDKNSILSKHDFSMVLIAKMQELAYTTIHRGNILQLYKQIKAMQENEKKIIQIQVPKPSSCVNFSAKAHKMIVQKTPTKWYIEEKYMDALKQISTILDPDYMIEAAAKEVKSKQTWAHPKSRKNLKKSHKRTYDEMENDDIDIEIGVDSIVEPPSKKQKILELDDTESEKEDEMEDHMHYDDDYIEEDHADLSFMIIPTELLRRFWNYEDGSVEELRLMTKQQYDTAKGGDPDKELSSKLGAMGLNSNDNSNSHNKNKKS